MLDLFNVTEERHAAHHPVTGPDVALEIWGGGYPLTMLPKVKKQSFLEATFWSSF